MRKIQEGLTILLKYYPLGTCAAEHDVLYAGGGEVQEINPEDLARLEDLGWLWDEELESWAIFT